MSITSVFAPDRMHIPDIEIFLSKGLELMGLALENQPEVVQRLTLYFQELKKWNQKVNLVARTLDDRRILENHFLDSLSLLSLFDPEKQDMETVLDVGTGAGFPGLVLKAVCPSLNIVLIEPRQNRFYFLKHIARVLDLDDLELLNGRLDETVGMQELSGRKFSFITSRAFTDIKRFVRLTAIYLAPEGRIVCMKGPGPDREMARFLQDNGLKASFAAETKKVPLCFSKAERNLIILKYSGSGSI